MDNLAKEAVLARSAGMSYGKWKAMQNRCTPAPKYTPEQMLAIETGKLKICSHCRELYGNGGIKYCSVECRKKARTQRGKRKA